MWSPPGVNQTNEATDISMAAPAGITYAAMWDVIMTVKWSSAQRMTPREIKGPYPS